ncbi:hypothetical protein OAJ30_03735 [Alphaproteobacteria bacterium]|nr:hypothetical protein [Alphaproteobacteria bacterium]
MSSCFSRPIPPDVINLNDDIDLLKGPKNEDGCTQYFPRSESGGPTIQVIYFYTKEGNITGESNPKECL